MVSLGVGAAGTAVSQLLLAAGCRHIVGVDRIGILSEDMPDLSASQRDYAAITNREHLTGGLA